MTTEEKIGQLMQHNANMFIDSSAAVTGDNSNKLGLSQEVINTVGSVLNFCSSVEMRTIQDMHLKNDRNKIPMLFMMDVVHGFRTIFPIPLALGCSFDPNLAARCSEMAADEATAGGVQVTFTPMVDYVRDARWGRVMETCGEEPLLNGMMGAAQIRAFRGKSLSDKTSMATCVKHFAAYGGAEAGRDYNTVELSEHMIVAGTDIPYFVQYPFLTGRLGSFKCGMWENIVWRKADSCRAFIGVLIAFFATFLFLV